MEANEAAGEGDCSVDAIVCLPVRPETINGWPGCLLGTRGGPWTSTSVKWECDGSLGAIERGLEEKEGEKRSIGAGGRSVQVVLTITS